MGKLVQRLHKGELVWVEVDKKKDRVDPAKVKLQGGKKRLGLPRGQWHPELVGRAGYPPTQEAWDARSARSKEVYAARKASGSLIQNRDQKPRGFKGTRAQCVAAREAAVKVAIRIVANMKKLGIITPGNADPRADMVFEEMVSIVIAGYTTENGLKEYAYSGKERIAAANLVMRYGCALPVSSQQVNLTSSEDFLLKLAEAEAAG